MNLQKGVHLTGLGTFTFSQQKLDIGNKSIMIQRPIFILSGKLIQSLGLKQTRPLAAATHIPVVVLNFTAVSQESPFSRAIVESCVRETILLLLRALAAEKTLFLSFKGLGVLYFRNNKMKFNKDFIKAMDGTGRLLLAFNKRPVSSVSLLSRAQSRTPRPQSADLVTLPPVCSQDHRAADGEGRGLSAALDQRSPAGFHPHRESEAHQTLQLDRKKAASPSKQPLTPSMNRPHTFNSSQKTPHRGEAPPANTVCSDHTRAGQELCYLCMQRAQRNVPLYLREQQQVEEKAQEKLLLLKEQQNDRLFMEEQQTKLKEQRKHAKQVATFNLQASETREKNHFPACPNSFVFPARPLTPPRKIQQQRYMNDLQTQISKQLKNLTEAQGSRLHMERLDHVQLVQEIALQKARQLQQKHEQTKEYKKALDTQIEDKSCLKPLEAHPDTPTFSQCQTAAKSAENPEREEKVSHINLSVATQKKNEELHKRQLQLQKEKEMLRRNKTEQILDQINRFEKRRDICKLLEGEWGRSVKLKHKRDEEERRFIRSAGQLLVDKLSEYRRCCQCQRKTTNCGESNIWRESRYLSGSQFMI
ncbi:coiled-coil domain-containing protein 81-like isoform X2 [Gouania willdenowi]|uniref:coiled-coil domain-containing protein 81-like isoform X2 n=1 Tax=Gouania willdenowi TaxID=441366 RepID=UPI001054AE6E|nr:coiled-coil domain-containing protein 81 isoform X2 [Gouania willdenowi]